MKILLIPEYFKYGGGSYTFLIKLLRLHHELNIKTSLLIEHHKKCSEIEEICEEYEVELYYCMDRRQLFTLPYLSIVYELIVYFLCIRKLSYDILVVSNIRVNLNLGYFIINSPIVFFMHSFPDRALSKKSSFMLLFAKLLRHNKQVVAVSHYAKLMVVRYMGFSSQYVRVVYNSIDESLVSAKKSNNKRIILTLGLMTHLKNPDVWIQVAKKVSSEIPDILFLWAGGHSNQVGLLMEKVVDLGLEKNVNLFDYRNDIKDLYLQSMIYFQPSVSESHGIAVIDAMAAGLPCVVSNVGGLRESVTENFTGYLCESTDVDCFAERIIFLLKNQDRGKQLGLNGRKRAVRLFSESSQKQKIASIYKRVRIGKDLYVRS